MQLSSPVQVLVVDRYDSPVSLALGRRFGALGNCEVRLDLARGQAHGDTCGYNAAVDVACFAAQHGFGPWWTPGPSAWQPHQVSLSDVAEANRYLWRNHVAPPAVESHAQLLSSGEVVDLVTKASGGAAGQA